MLPEEDVVRLRHMLDAAREAVRFVEGRKPEDLESDSMLSFALARALEIIGEAAKQLSAPAKAAAPDLPWALIINMRHRIVHAYFDVKPERLWTTAVEDLPRLIRELGRLLTGF